MFTMKIPRALAVIVITGLAVHYLELTVKLPAKVSIQPPTYDRNSGNSLRSSQPPKAATDPPPAIHADDYTLHQDNDSHEPDSELSASENNVQTATANSAHVGVAASISPSQSPSVSKSASRSEAVSSSISETSTPSPSQSAARSRDTVLDSLVMQRRPARPKRHGGMNIIAPPLDPTSSKTCVMIGSWSETCVYRNMCYDTENWYLIRNDVDPDISVEEQEPFYPYNDFQTGIVYPQSPIPPVGRDFFPYQDGGWQGRYIHPKHIVKHEQAGNQVYWSDSVPWIPGFKYHLANTYYFTSRMMPFYVARRLNASGLLREPLPSLGPNDFIYNPSFKAERFDDEWLMTMQQITTGSANTRVEFGLREWENSINRTSWMCFKKVVHIPPFPMAVPDPETGALYRQELYSVYGMKVPTGPRPPKVLFWLRNTNIGRHFVNIDDMISVVEAYNINYTIAYDFEIPPFKEQLDLWSTHGVVVCAHGAGLMNMLFMPAFGAVVEVFPNHFHHNLYSALAAMMGQGHFPVHPSSAAPMWANEPEYFEHNCSDWTATEMPNQSAYCKSSKLNYPITVDIPDFEIAVVNALVHIGANITLRNPLPGVSEWE